MDVGSPVQCVLGHVQEAALRIPCLEGPSPPTRGTWTHREAGKALAQLVPSVRTRRPAWGPRRRTWELRLAGTRDSVGELQALRACRSGLWEPCTPAPASAFSSGKQFFNY